MGLSTFLNGGTAVQLRGLAFLALSDTGQVGSATVVSDGGGGGTTTWTYGDTIPCRVDSMGGGEEVVAERISDRSTHLITTPAGTVVTLSDRFQVIDVATFEVTAVQSRTADVLTFFEGQAIDEATGEPLGMGAPLGGMAPLLIDGEPWSPPPEP